MASPAMTFNAAGNARTSASLGAGASATFLIDLSTKFEGQLTIDNTPGAAIATTRGLQVTLQAQKNSVPAYETIGRIIGTLPSTTASTLESQTFFIPTGKYEVRIKTLDVTNALTVAVTLITIDSVA